MLDLNWEAWTADGSVDKDAYRILATTPTFDHCVFTVRSDFDPELEKEWLAALFAMSYENPDHREMMDMEGLKAWEPGRTSGFGPLDAAVRSQHYFEGAAS
jgi:ABC-type phosphate/phosphonate transport system substrate-binding protein